MRKISPLLLLTLFCVGCSGDTKSALGLKKPAPDEFMVISNPPLSVPPDFALNKPHEASEEPYNQQSMKTSNNAKLDKSDKEFLDKLGAKKQVTEAGKLVDSEYQKTIQQKNEGGFIRKTASKLHGSSDKVIDPITEKERIQNNIKEGKPINEGEVQNKSSSTLERMFN